MQVEHGLQSWTYGVELWVSEASFLPEEGSGMASHFFMVHPKVSSVFT